MFCNPLIQRYRFSNLNLKNIVMASLIYLVFLGIFFSIDYFIKDVSIRTRTIFIQLLLVEAIILLCVTVKNSAMVIPNEKTRNSYVFFKLTPLTSFQKMSGILIGRNILPLIFALVNGALLLGVIFWIGEQVLHRIMILLTLCSVSVLFNSLAMLMSTMFSRKSKMSQMSVFFAIFFAFSFMSGGVGYISDNPSSIFTKVNFYSLSVPILVIMIALAGYYSVWLFLGIMRRFTFENLSLFNKRGGVLFMLGHIVLCVGFFWDQMRELCPVVFVAYSSIIMIPAVIIPMLSSCDMSAYKEMTIKYSKEIQLLSLLRSSNLIVPVMLLLMWIVSCTAFFPMIESGLFLIVLFVLEICFAYVTFNLFLECHNIERGDKKKLFTLSMILLMVYLIVPLIIGGVTEKEIVLALSPLGMIPTIIDSIAYHEKVQFVSAVSFIGYHFVIICLAAAYISRGYSRVLSFRNSVD